MAGAGKKWLTGCGIGCGLLIVVMGGIGTCGYMGIMKVSERGDRINATFDQIDTRFGDPTDFTPPPDGRLSADRLEVFLAVRDGMAPAGVEVEDVFSTLGTREGGGPIAKIKAGLRLLPAMMGFIEERNRMLLEHGMGVGEYQFIYVLAYYGLLDKDPADGPAFTISDTDDAEDSGFRWRGHADDQDEESVREKRNRSIREFVNRTQRRMLQNQLAALDTEISRTGAAAAGDLVNLDLTTWRTDLAAEVQAMNDETLRLPWEEELPAQLRRSLEPFADRLEAAYAPTTGVLEMRLGNHD